MSIRVILLATMALVSGGLAQQYEYEEEYYDYDEYQEYPDYNYKVRRLTKSSLDTNLLVKCRFFYNRLTGPRQLPVTP